MSANTHRVSRNSSRMCSAKYKSKSWPDKPTNAGLASRLSLINPDPSSLRQLSNPTELLSEQHPMMLPILHQVPPHHSLCPPPSQNPRKNQTHGQRQIVGTQEITGSPNPGHLLPSDESKQLREERISAKEQPDNIELESISRYREWVLQ